MSVQTEMPRYRCHKEVWALKIAAIELDRPPSAECILSETGDGATLTPEDTRYAKFKVTGEYLRKHNPHVGGYYVMYADGYLSFSPAKAFEDGYTLIK